MTRMHNNNTYFSDCRGCSLVYTYKAEYWLDDIVRCKSPIPIKFGDTIEIIPQISRLVTE